MRLVGLILLSVLLAIAAACDRAEPGSQEGAQQAEHRYALLRDGAWRLQDAADPAADDRVASIERPPLDWYAEYVETAPRRAMVRLSGHRATFDGARSELEEVGFVLDDVDIESWTATGGTTTETGSRPTVILLDNGGSSLILLSYELGADALAQLAGAVETADDAAWARAGGVVR